MADEHERPEPIFSTRSSHSGADFEAGRVGRPRGEEAPLGMAPPSPLGRNESSPARGRASPARGGGGFAGSAEPLSPAAASAGSTRSSPRLASNMASPGESRQSARAESREAEDDLQAELRKPWRGQADKLKPAQKDVLACFEEQGVMKNVMDEWMTA